MAARNAPLGYRWAALLPPSPPGHRHTRRAQQRVPPAAAPLTPQLPLPHLPLSAPARQPLTPSWGCSPSPGELHLKLRAPAAAGRAATPRERQVPPVTPRRTHQVLGVLVHVGHAAPVVLVEEHHVPHAQQHQGRQRPVEERCQRRQPAARPPHGTPRSGALLPAGSPRTRARRGGAGRQRHRPGGGAGGRPGWRLNLAAAGARVRPPCWGGRAAAGPRGPPAMSRLAGKVCPP